MGVNVLLSVKITRKSFIFIPLYEDKLFMLDVRNNLVSLNQSFRVYFCSN